MLRCDLGSAEGANITKESCICWSLQAQHTQLHTTGLQTLSKEKGSGKMLIRRNRVTSQENEHKN